MDILAIIVTAFWAMLPAYIPNNAAVLAGGGRPIDGGRTMGDSRLLGDGKTWRGTAVGWGVGVLVAIALNLLEPTASDTLGIELPVFPVAIAIIFPLGAMLGDIAASFLKRRSGRERGAPYPGVDQLDFVVVSLFLAFCVDALLGLSWFGETFTVPVLAVVLVVTPVLHVGTNVLAYALGVKDEPW